MSLWVGSFSDDSFPGIAVRRRETQVAERWADTISAASMGTGTQWTTDSPPDAAGLTLSRFSHAAPGQVPGPQNASGNPSLDDEVTFISGLDSDGRLALVSYPAWNEGTRPADYSGGYTLALKWGMPIAGTAGGTVSYYFDSASNWSDIEKGFLTAGLALWSAEANIHFTLTDNPGSAQIAFIRGSTNKAYTSPDTPVPLPAGAGLTGGATLLQFSGAKITIDTSVAGFGPIGGFSSYGGYPLMTLLHEEGHAIGLGHAGPYNSTKTRSQQFSAYDTRLWSVMSYFDNAAGTLFPATSNTSWSGNYPTTPMMADILAAQRLYGIPDSTPLSGGQVFGFNTNIVGDIRPFFDFTINTRPVITLWDKGSNNTLDLSGFGTGTSISLLPGSFSSVGGLSNNLGIAPDTAIDRLILGPAIDLVTGNNNGDYIDAGGGDDVIHCGSGNDTVIGGAGDDTLYGGAGMDAAQFSGSLYDYTIRQRGASTIVSGQDGTDILWEVESLRFSDATVDDAASVLQLRYVDAWLIESLFVPDAGQGMAPMALVSGSLWHGVLDGALPLQAGVNPPELFGSGSGTVPLFTAPG